jgi:hypothetical protein
MSIIIGSKETLVGIGTILYIPRLDGKSKARTPKFPPMTDLMELLEFIHQH